MSKSKQRRNKPPRPPVNAEQFSGLHNIDKSAQYSGAARFIEIAPPGIQFRGLTNVDHITSITFANKVEDVEVLDEGGIGKEAVLDDEGGIIEAAVPPPTHVERHVTGYQVVVGIGGQQNEFTFSRFEIGIAYYNDLLDMITVVGVPCVLQPRIVPPLPPEEDKSSAIVGPDGVPLEVAGIEAGKEGEDLEDPEIDELDSIADEIAEEKIEAADKPTKH